MSQQAISAMEKLPSAIEKFLWFQTITIGVWTDLFRVAGWKTYLKKQILMSAMGDLCPQVRSVRQGTWRQYRLRMCSLRTFYASLWSRDFLRMKCRSRAAFFITIIFTCKCKNHLFWMPTNGYLSFFAFNFMCQST